MKIFFPFHIGSGNRGCEGILRGTLNILSVSKENAFALDRDNTECSLDTKLGLNDIVTLKVRNNRSIFMKAIKRIGFENESYYISPFNEFLSSIDNNSVALFTGGDLFCYPETIKENIAISRHLESRGIDSVLWGASVEERYLTQEVIDQLKKYKCIVCRESKTNDALVSRGINNVLCFPDPAFSLKPIECELPRIFKSSRVIGINISNMVNSQSFDMDTEFIKCMRIMVDGILKETDYSILLIPHVTWGRQDDRKMCNAFKSLYSTEERVSVLNMGELGYLQIRNIISNCDLFIGARTHSVISAYSTCVPTIALGYSVKAKGISKDLGLDKRLLFDSKNIKSKDDLMNSFIYLDENQQSIKSHLQYVIPQYSKKAYDAKCIMDYFD